MTSISRRQRAEGPTAWRVQYRDPGNPTPTTATFDDDETAARFGTLVDRLGEGRATPEAPQRIR